MFGLSACSAYSKLTLLAQNGATKAGASSTSAAKGKGKAKEKTVVSHREDKARKRHDALFRDDEPSSGGFALAKLQQKLTARDDSPSRPTASTSRPTTSSSATAKPKSVTAKSSAALSRTSSTSSTGSAPGAAGGSVRDRLKAGFSDAPQKLNVVKRDNRTVEEIERDMKLRKEKEAAARHGGSAPSTSAAAATTTIKSASRSPAPARPASKTKPARRARSVTPSDEDDESDMSTSSTEQRKRKRSRYEKERGLNSAQRDAIWSLMGRNRHADVARERAFDSDDSDMEATGADVLLEERRACAHLPHLAFDLALTPCIYSARLAAKEDAEEQERLRRYAEEKKKRKIQSSK